LRLIQARWPAIRAKLQAQLMTADRLRELLAAAGCPTDPAAISLDLGRLRQSYWLARTIRSRYTVLNLATETGLLDERVAELFGPAATGRAVRPDDELIEKLVQWKLRYQPAVGGAADNWLPNAYC
jgi:hypothetical protein